MVWKNGVLPSKDAHHTAIYVHKYLNSDVKIKKTTLKIGVIMSKLTRKKDEIDRKYAQQTE